MLLIVLIEETSDSCGSRRVYTYVAAVDMYATFLYWLDVHQSADDYETSYDMCPIYEYPYILGSEAKMAVDAVWTPKV